MADFRETLILLDEADNEEKDHLKSEAEIIDKAITRAKANLKSEVDNRSVDIQNTDFSSQVSFFKAKIIGNWNLELARFEKIVNFSGVEFHKPFNLSQAEFKVPPIFSGAKFNYQIGEKKWDDFWEKAKSSDSYLHYMRLKKIAADAQDHETELQLFVLETKAKRFHYHSWPGDSIALIYNVLYDMTSEFGKSGFRPPLWLFLTLFATECSTAVVANPPRSVLELDGDVFAFTASNIFSFTSMASDMRNNSIKSLCNVAEVKDCPNIHTYYTIAGFSSFFSLIFFFLLGLGIRNRFRIK